MGQIGPKTIRGRLREARLKGDITDEYNSYKEEAFDIQLQASFLFRGVNYTTEYDTIEDMTATSMSLEKAFNYGGNPFVVIYVPNQKVYGLPIFCEKSGHGTNLDSEILLIEPQSYLQEITDKHKINIITRMLSESLKTKLDVDEDEVFDPFRDIKLYISNFPESSQRETLT
tara:strand:- start:392 stop:907 length:516 start_codon:yes stop_codon:yes gene_type:complete